MTFHARRRGGAAWPEYRTRRESGIWMDVAAVYPGPRPRPAANDDVVRAPAEADASPAPRQEGADEDARSERDRAADKEARARPVEDHRRIVVRNIQQIRIHRQNLDITRPRCYYAVLRICAQVAVVIRALALVLHRIHDAATICQHCVSQLLSPVHVARHQVEYAWEGQERLNAGVPGQII